MKNALVIILLLLAGCSSPTIRDQTVLSRASDQAAGREVSDEGAKYPEGCRLGRDFPPEREICTFDTTLPPCPDTGPAEFHDDETYPCVGGNWGGLGSEGSCETEGLKLARLIEKRRSGEAAARDVAYQVAHLDNNGCDETVEAVLKG